MTFKRFFTHWPDVKAPISSIVTGSGRTLSFVHPVIVTSRVRVHLPEEVQIVQEDVMRTLLKLLIPVSIIALGGCVVAPPYGYYRGYYGPRVAVVAPAPVVVVRPFR
jgi:hypothetical protein